MLIKENYEKLEQNLEGKMFTEILLSKGDINSDSRRLFLVKCLYFIMSTRDFEKIDNFLNRYYRAIFPYEYLKEKL